MVRADSDYPPGAQVYLCYSHVTSAQLLSQYGFVEDPHAVVFPRDNPAERVELSPGPPVTDIDFGLRVEVRSKVTLYHSTFTFTFIQSVSVSRAKYVR